MKQLASTKKISSRAHALRGVARVNVAWLITVGVLMLVGFVTAFMLNSDLSVERDRLAGVRSDLEEAQSSVLVVNQKMSRQSEAVGFLSDPDATFKEIDVASLKAHLVSMRDNFGLTSDQYPTVHSLFEELPIDGAESAHKDSVLADLFKRRQERIDTLVAHTVSLEADLNKSRDSLSSIQATKDDEIRKLRTELSDEQASAARRQTELEDQSDRLRDQVANLDNEGRSLRDQIEELNREMGRTARDYERDINRLRDDTKIFREPLDTLPDGSVIAVSDGIPLGWIDIGARNRLAVGTRFEVYSGDPGSYSGDPETDVKKGECVVTSTQSNRAEVLLQGVVDPYDPIVPGDILVNKVYDPTTRRKAVLVGRFDGDYNEKALRTLLAEIGVDVQVQAGVGINYVIVGDEEYTDEDGEAYETPRQPEEFTEYLEARSKGAVVVGIDYMRRYFKL